MVIGVVLAALPTLGHIDQTIIMSRLHPRSTAEHLNLTRLLFSATYLLHIIGIALTSKRLLSIVKDVHNF